MQSTNLTAYGNTPMTALTVCVLTFSFLFGLPTHCYVTWLIMTGTRNGVASEFFTINLSVSEIWTSLDCLVFVLSNWFLQLAAVALFLQGLSIAGRALFQCLMCVERYLAVVHPVTFLKYKPLRYRVICCTAVTCNAHTWFFITQFFLLLGIQSFCLVAVLRALSLRERKRRKTTRREEHFSSF